ncbi:preprotein translocase subunit SecG [Mesoplasma lactucae]|uniref:Protein-export membrane protein SecG n=1 Tax=Mesoplasma lactucae ATCC 49193 TaxID=81460 RepID=A0A291ISA4_9MOLU|nr:preprotein translocase subunit SecG [Mesoplasma lactucae]ATG97825.1 preprotein translocase subunit SecG [Mesoplasma lactucae ATCC 49193]
MATTDNSANATANRIILAFEIVMMVISVAMIIVGLLQNKKSQTGLSALNGGNEELFTNSKERGADKVFSIWMLSLGIAFFVITLVICILTNTILK